MTEQEIIAGEKSYIRRMQWVFVIAVTVIALTTISGIASLYALAVSMLVGLVWFGSMLLRMRSRHIDAQLIFLSLLLSTNLIILKPMAHGNALSMQLIFLSFLVMSGSALLFRRLVFKFMRTQPSQSVPLNPPT